MSSHTLTALVRPLRWAVLTPARKLARHWVARRRIRSLEGLDDRLLDDIGVSRADVMWAAQLPLSVNPALELEDVAVRRRASMRRHNRISAGAGDARRS